MNKIIPTLRGKLKRHLALFLYLLAPVAAQAQVDTYQFAATAGTFTPLTGGTPLAILGDDQIAPATIPFPFSFDGVPYTTAYVSSNGYVSFNSSAATFSYNNALAGGTIATDKPLVAPFWDDLNGTGGSAAYTTTGTAPTRVFTVEWLNFFRYSTTNGPQLSLQVKLYEGTNVVQFVYRREANAFSSINGASIGIASAVSNNTDTFLSLNNSSATPSASSTVETDNIMTVPATGQVYTFTPRPVLPCATPRNLTATNITATSAQLNWTVTGGTGPFTVVYGLTGFNPAVPAQVLGTLTATTTNIPVTGLTASTGYQFYVTQNCGGANGNSYQSNAGSFQSACLTPLYAALPFSENFEGTWLSRCDNHDVPSNNWRNTPATGNNAWRRDDDASTANWTNPTLGAFTVGGPQGLHTARFHDYGAVNGTVGTLDLFVNLSGTGSRVLQFDYLNTAGTDSLTVQVSTNGGATFGPVLLALNQSANFARQSVSLPAGGTATSVVRFRARAAGFTSDLGLDNVTIANLTSVPDCALTPTPANNATGVVRPVAITWVPGGNIPTSYNVYFGTTATPPLVTNTTGTSYTPTGNLAGNTVYYYQIVPVNGLGTAVGCPVYSFTTGTVILYCNTGLGGSCGGNNITAASIQNTTFNPANLTCTNANGQAYTAYPATPASNTATLLKGTSYPLSVTTDGGSIISAWIDYNQNGAFEASEHTQVATNSTANTPDVVNILIPLTAAQGLTGMRIRSRLSGNPNGPGDACTNFGSGEAKDFLVTIGPASACPQPSGLTATSLTTTGATLNFTAPGAGTYTVYYGVAGFTPGGTGSTTVVVANPANPTVLTGLTSGTAYQFYVQRDCGVVGLSQQSGPVNFATIITNDDPCGAVNLTINPSCTPITATNVGATTTTPNGYTNPGTGCSGFNFAPKDVWYKFTTAATGPTSTGVRISVTGGVASTLQGFSGASCTGVLTPLACSGAALNVAAPPLNLTSLTPSTTYYVRVMGFSGAAALGSFTICAAAVPNCPTPTVLSADSLTNTTARLTWTAPATAGNTFTIIYGPQGFSPIGGGTTIMGIIAPNGAYHLTGLQADTDYCYYIRQNCAGFNGNSSLTGPFCFHTTLTPPSNDEPCGALPLVSATALTVTNVGATPSTQFGIQLPACAPTNVPKDVWFVMNPATSTVTFTLLGSAPGMLRVFESPNCGAGPFTQVFCQAANGGFPVPFAVTGLTANRNYYVAVSGFAGLSTPGSFTISASTLGTVLAAHSPAAGRNLLVYPNPSNTGQLTLRLDAGTTGQATLFNALGQEVRRQTLPAGSTEHTLTTRGLATGLYTLRVLLGTEVLTRKVVLE